jgi:hypothetical protein
VELGAFNPCVTGSNPVRPPSYPSTTRQPAQREKWLVREVSRDGHPLPFALCDTRVIPAELSYQDREWSWLTTGGTDPHEGTAGTPRR